MKNIKAVDVSEIEKLAKYKCGWISPSGGIMPPVVIDLNDLRTLLDRSPSVSEPTIPEGYALTEPTEAEYIEHAEQEELLLFASEDDYLAIANGVWELFVKRYKAMLSAYKPQADDVRKDAERYRWLRDKAMHGGINCPSVVKPEPNDQWTIDTYLYRDDLDSAIDKARE